MSDVFAGISCLIALIALVQSVVSGRKVKDLDLQLKQKDLELHNENEADAKKADVEVNMIETEGRKLNILRFYNKGRADAYNVSFDIVSDKVDNDTSFIWTRGCFHIQSFCHFKILTFHSSTMSLNHIRQFLLFGMTNLVKDEQRKW